MFLLNKGLVLLLLAAIACFPFRSSFAVTPTALEYIEFYNQNKGFLRDHESAKKALKAKYREVALEEFQGNIFEFVAETFGIFDQYLAERSRIKKYVTDYMVSSSALKCVEALSDLIQELSAQVNQTSGDGENPPSSDDDLVTSLIEQISVGPHSLHSLRGLETLMKSAVRSQNKSCSGPLTILSSVIGGCILPFYSRACLMSLTETAFPVIWTITRNLAVPPVGTWEYTLVYLPALEHAQGQAFMNSGPILSGVWVLGSGISYGVWKLISWSSNAAHRQIVRIYHFCESQHGNMSTRMAQTGDDGGSIEMSAPLLPIHEGSFHCEETAAFNTPGTLGPEQSLD